MNEGDLVLVRYTGKAEGEVFDTTEKEKAEEEGLHREDRDYRPIPVLIGEDYVIEGFEESVKDLDVGDEKEVEIPQEKAYGERDSDKVETYPEKEFEKQDVNVRRGEEIMIGNQRGKVISKGSGRVRIDFNHPLAGKDLEYWLKVEEQVTDDEEKAEYIYDYRVGHGDVDIEDGKAKFSRTHSHGDHQHQMPEELIEKVTEEIEQYTDLEVEVEE